MAKVIHFEIPAEDPEKVGQFYREAFGWEIRKWENQDYWLIMAGPKEEPGVNGAIYKKGQNDKTINTISVEKIEEAMEKVKKAGGEILGEVIDIPKVGRFIYAKDVEGTPFGILQVSDEMKKM
jgi:uncharacterized protein